MSVNLTGPFFSITYEHRSTGFGEVRSCVSHERDVEAQDAHTDKMRARLSELKTNKEYQAHLFELQMANKKKSEIEDKVLAWMEKIEQLQQTAKEAQDKVRVAEQVFTKEKQVLDELDSRLSAELAELESQQRDRSGKVEPGLLARYTKLKVARKDQPLAAIKGGMVRQWQDLFYEGRYASSYLDTTPDFVKLAEAYGAVGLRPGKVGDLDGVLKEAIAAKGPVIVDVPTHPFENVYPMIPAGGCNHEMILEDPPELKQKQSGTAKTAPQDKDTILTA